MTVIDPVKELQARAVAAGSHVKAGKALGLTETQISKLLHGKQQFTRKILAKLGLRTVVVSMQDQDVRP